VLSSAHCFKVLVNDGPHFASGGRDYTIVIWDLKGELVVQLKWKHRSYVTRLFGLCFGLCVFH